MDSFIKNQSQSYRKGHQFRSRRGPIRLWSGSLLMILFALSIPIPIAAAIYGALTSDREWLVNALKLAGIAFGLGLLFFIVAYGAICPLCRGRMLLSSGASRNTKSPKLFGSHRLPVILSVLTLRTFRCPYCGEPCECRRRQQEKAA